MQLLRRILNLIVDILLGKIVDEVMQRLTLRDLQMILLGMFIMAIIHHTL